MKSTYGKKTLCMLGVILALSAAIATTSAAAEILVWHTRTAAEKVKGNEGKLLKKGESKEAAFTAESTKTMEAIKGVFHQAGQSYGFTCAKGSGKGSVIGGEPGTASVKSLIFSECHPWGLGSSCEIKQAPRLENVEAELTRLASGTLSLELKGINTEKQNSNKVFVEFNSTCISPSKYNILGTLGATTPAREEFEQAFGLTFPTTPLENTKLTWSGERVEIEGKITMTLVNGETIAIY